MRFWNELFPKWELNQVIRGKWEITNTTNGENPYVTSEIAIFEIYYSKRLNKYRIEMSGFRPKDHPQYPVIVQWIVKQNNLETKKINIK